MKMAFSPAIPIYMQIIDKIKHEIVSGERLPGSRVETVRDMAQDMGVNPNTVQRAFAELEREGLMFTERTSGRYITDDAELIKKIKEELIFSSIADFVSHMRKSGFTDDDIVRLVKKYIEEDGGND